MIHVEPSWRELLSNLAHHGQARRRIYVLGGVDTGKTTLCAYLVEQLARTAPTARVDCDPGQAVLGPPGTLGLATYRDGQQRLEALRFVGAVSPPGHLLPMLTGAARLLRRAGDAWRVVLDSSGFAEGDVAREFQFQTLDLLEVDDLVAIQRRDELESLLSIFQARGLRVHRLGVSPAVKARSWETRQQYRERRFREYFAAAQATELPVEGLGRHGRTDGEAHGLEPGRLTGLCDARGFALTLAIVQSMAPDGRTLRLLARPLDVRAVASIHVGSVRLDLAGRHERI